MRIIRETTAAGFDTYVMLNKGEIVTAASLDFIDWLARNHVLLHDKNLQALRKHHVRSFGTA